MKRQKVELTITIELSDYKLDDEEKKWYDEDILIVGDITLHSNEIGDSLGDIIKVENIQWVE